MRIGAFRGDVANGPIDKVVEAARSAADDGYATFWQPQIFGCDALTVLAVVGAAVPDIELGTAVVPTYPRHPIMLAQQALTTQSASGGRLALGIGLSHKLVIEGMFGLSFEKPVRHMREYLEILTPLLRSGSASFTGETLSGNAGIEVRGATAPPVLLAALGERMLALAGAMTEGTITWMTGPATIESHIVPTITGAAREAGRSAPRVAVGLPVCVTNDADGACERAAQTFEIYGTLPSYRAMLDREGAAGPPDVAIVGDESVVRKGLERLEAVGTTDFVANVFGNREERSETYALLRSLNLSKR